MADKLNAWERHIVNTAFEAGDRYARIMVNQPDRFDAIDDVITELEQVKEPKEDE